MAYWATIWLARVLSRLFLAPPKPVILTCFLFPGLFVWGTGPMKETLVLLFFALFFQGITLLYFEAKLWKGMLISVAGAGLIWFTKFYVIVCLLPFLVLWLIWQKTGRNEVYKTLGFVMSSLLLAGIGIGAGWLFDFPIWQTIAFKQNNFMNLAISENSGSLTDAFYLSGTAESILSALPYAWFKAFLMPLPHQVTSIVFIAPLIENLVFILALFFLIWKRALHWSNSRLWLSAFFLLTFFALLGLTTPVLGGLFRYKIPVWPLLAATFWHLYSLAEARSKDPLP